MFEVTVGGRSLNSVCGWGELEFTTVWPGGYGEASWETTYGGLPSSLQNAGLPVTVRSGGVVVWTGQLVEPDASADRLVAQGPHTLAGDYLALDGSSNATAVPDTAIDQAIARGLPWKRTESFGASTATIDISSGPVALGQLLDYRAENNATRWGVVGADRRVVRRADPTTPSWHVLALDGGLGTARDNYASTLVGLFLDSAAGGAFAKVSVTDALAERRHGHAETPVDLTGRGQITAARATTLLTNLLALGRSKPQWTAGMEFRHGEVLNAGGAPVALDQVYAGGLLRVHSNFDDAAALDGRMYIDVLIGETRLRDGVLSVTPLEVASRSHTDLVAELFERSRKR